ncbi:MAG: TatD family hydrolase [Bryobacterales bacterium]
MVIDSHCHLDGPRFEEDRDAVLDRAREAGVEAFLTIGTGDGPPDLECALRIAERYPDVYATVGVHPHDAGKAELATLGELTKLCAERKVLAVGEIGLDYHYDHSPRDVQKRVFVEQMGIAADCEKPIIIHTREAWDDTLDLLRSNWASTGLGGILHCFSGNLEQAEMALGMGFFISFAGILTFGRSHELREVAAALPADRILVETDSPYLTPEPHRKVRRNEPRYVVDTARRLAEVRGVSYEEVAAETTRNFRKLFGLP